MVRIGKTADQVHIVFRTWRSRLGLNGKLASDK
jgi:hypothetical protein